MSKIILSAIVENISTRSDGTFKIVIGTNEIDKQSVSELFELRNTFCKLLLTSNNITPLDDKLIDELKIKDGKKVKTKSQRLRAVLYREWEQQGLQIEFDTYYDTIMEGYIEKHKANLDQ